MTGKFRRNIGPSYADLALGRGRPGPNMGRPGGAGDGGRAGGVRVEHICPECGGDFAEHLGALIVVTTCPACGGKGRLSDDELSAYLRTQS